LELFKAFNQHDIESVMGFFADDFTYNSVTRYILSKEEYRKFIDVLYASFSDIRFQVNRIVSQENTVVAETIFRGTHKGEYLGLPATGKSVEAPSVYIFDFEIDKITLVKYYSNLQSFVDQLRE
jgi:steroid delta-isomerase-like uncharacterized protein